MLLKSRRILGQTHTLKTFAEKTGAFVYLDGEEEDYRIITNDIFDDEFKYNQFVNM
jgi:hypothetical protein